MTRVAMVAVGVVSFGAAFALGCGSLETQDAADETTTAVAAAGAAGQPTHDTATARAESPTPTPVLATPITTFEGAFMIVGGEVWVDAEPTSETVHAFIGDVECASADPVTPPDAYLPRLTLVIPASSAKAGCGTPGAIIRFEIGGRAARQTAGWVAGAGVALTLSAGPEAAVYSGQLSFDALPVGLSVVPVVDGQECGRQLDAFQGQGPLWGYEVLVYPDEVSPGCGRDAAKVTLRVVRFDKRTGGKSIVGEVPEVQADWAPGVRTTLSDARVTENTGAQE